MREKMIFGSWDGKPLEWLVLDKDGESLTLWCCRSVADMRFAEGYSPFYAESGVRRFLNDEFYSKAFSDVEKERILLSEIDMSERQTYFGTVSYGLPLFRREPLEERVYLLSVREMMSTDALTPDELYQVGKGKIWTRSPEMQQTVSTVHIDDEILKGKSPYVTVTESYDYMSDTVKSSRSPNSVYPTAIRGVVPTVRIRK